MRIPNFDSNEPAPEGGVSVQETLAELARNVREIWIAEKRQYQQSQSGQPSTWVPGPQLDGGCSASGRVTTPVWPKLAKFIFENGLHPVFFIRAQFHQCGGRPPLNPLMLTNDKAVQRYKHFVASKADIKDLVVARDTQMRAARDAVELNKRFYGPTNIDIYRDVILDNNVDITALFRYVLALQCKQQDLANLWHDAALKQYLYEQDAYDLAWGQMVPAQLKQEAMEIRGRVALASD